MKPYSDSIKNAISGSDCVIIMNAWKDYVNLKNSDFKKMRNKNVIDTRRILSNKKLTVNYHTLGIGK